MFTGELVYIDPSGLVALNSSLLIAAQGRGRDRYRYRFFYSRFVSTHEKRRTWDSCIFDPDSDSDPDSEERLHSRL